MPTKTSKSNNTQKAGTQKAGTQKAGTTSSAGAAKKTSTTSKTDAAKKTSSAQKSSTQKSTKTKASSSSRTKATSQTKKASQTSAKAKPEVAADTAPELSTGDTRAMLQDVLSDSPHDPQSFESLERLQGAGVQAIELLQKYRAAMREMEVRLEVVDQDLRLKKNRNPIHHIESRIKTPSSILDKLERYGLDPTIENVERNIMDIAGVRVICSYIHDVYNLYTLLRKQDDLEIVTIKDYIADPKPNGYRSLHLIVRVPVYFMDEKGLIPVEVQLRTVAMDFWASLEHDLKYKAVRELEGIDTYDELKDCSNIIEEVEARMQILARALELPE